MLYGPIYPLSLISRRSASRIMTSNIGVPFECWMCGSTKDGCVQWPAVLGLKGGNLITSPGCGCISYPRFSLRRFGRQTLAVNIGVPLYLLYVVGGTGGDGLFVLMLTLCGPFCCRMISKLEVCAA